MLRHRLAAPMLLTLRAIRPFRPMRAGFRILLFHHVPEQSFAAFERLVVHVKERHGVLSPSEAADWITGDKRPQPPRDGSRPPCLFSFDDGFASNFELATAVLARHGVRALFFVCPGLVELTGTAQPAAIASRIFDGRMEPERLDPALRIMTWDELRDLGSAGHAIGCHGMEHRRLSRLDGDDLCREIIDAGELLEARLGQSTPWSAYAFGDIDSISRPALKVVAEMFRFCRSGVRGINASGTPPHGLFADTVNIATPFSYQKLILEGGLDGRYSAARRRLAGLAAGLT